MTDHIPTPAQSGKLQMTREEAIAIVIKTPSRVIDRLRNDRPQWLCDVLTQEAAEDQVDLFVALGILKLTDAAVSTPGDEK